MKRVGLMWGLALALWLCPPAEAGLWGEFSLGLSFDYANSEMSLDDLKGEGLVDDLGAAEHDFDYRREYYALMLVARWDPLAYLGLEGMVGLTNLRFEQDYNGSEPSLSSQTLSGELNNPLLGMNLYFQYPRDGFFLGATLSGRYAPCRRIDGGFLWPDLTDDEADVTWWSLGLLLKLGFGFDWLSVYAGPAFTLGRMSVESEAIAPDASVDYEFEYEPDDQFGARLGGDLRLGRHWQGSVQVRCLDELGLSLGLAYVF